VRIIEKLAEGLRILAKYDSSVAAEHDIVYAGPYIASVVSEADRVQLEAMGWHICSETGSWARFV